jgi:hypothetical protein
MKNDVILFPISDNKVTGNLVVRAETANNDGALVTIRATKRHFFNLQQLPEGKKPWVECKDTMKWGEFALQNGIVLEDAYLEPQPERLIKSADGKPRTDQDGKPTGEVWHEIRFRD